MDNTRFTKLQSQLEYKDIKIGTITIPDCGYYNITSYRPSTPSGKSLIFVVIQDYLHGTGAMSVDAYGNYLSAAKGEISNIILRYFYW